MLTRVGMKKKRIEAAGVTVSITPPERGRSAAKGRRVGVKMTRKSTKWIHEGKYAAEVPVELIEDDTAWSPYLTPEDVKKLETMRLALKRGDVTEAAKHAQVFELKPVAAE